MDEVIRRDFKISFLIGIVVGILLLPTIRNFGVTINLFSTAVSVAVLTVITPLGYLVAYWLSRWWPVMLQFIKFAIVGGLNFTIDLAVLNLAIYLSGISAGLFYSVFKAVSFTIAVVNSYFWNKYWTFHVGGAPQAVEFTKFVAVNLIGFGINVGVASAVVNLIGAPVGISAEIWANVGAVTASVAALFWNFIGMKFIVFKR